MPLMNKAGVSVLLRGSFDNLTGFRAGDAELGMLSPGFDGGRAFTRRVEADGVHICDISYGGGTKESLRDEMPLWTKELQCWRTNRIVTVTFLDGTQEIWTLMTFLLEQGGAEITHPIHGRTQKVAQFRQSFKTRSFV